jgi:hypothetical protein
MRVWLGVVVTFGALVGLGYGLRSEIATRAFAFIIDQREGIRCSHPRLEVAKSLDAVVLAPIECSFNAGPLASAQTFAPAKITLARFAVERIHVARAAMNFRKRDVSDIPSNTLEDIANLTGMRDQLIKAVMDASEMYSQDAPPVSVDRLTILRERERESVIHDFVMTKDGMWSRSRGSKVEVGIEGLAALRNFDRRVTATRGKLRLDIYLGDGEPGEKPDVELWLDGTHLDGRNPRFQLSLHDPGD